MNAYFNAMRVLLRNQKSPAQYLQNIQTLQRLFSEMSFAERHMQTEFEAGFDHAKKALQEHTEVLLGAIQQNGDIPRYATMLLEAMCNLHRLYMQQPVADYLSQQEKNSLLISKIAFTLGALLSIAAVVTFVLPIMLTASPCFQIWGLVTFGFLFLATLSAAGLSFGFDYLEKPIRGDTKILKTFADTAKKNQYVDFSVFEAHPGPSCEIVQNVPQPFSYNLNVPFPQ